jgi:hypothetical protein
MEVNIEDDVKALLSLCSLPKSFEHFKDIIHYGKEGTYHYFGGGPSGFENEGIDQIQGLEG